MEQRQGRSWFHHARHHPVTRTTGFALLHTSRLARRLLTILLGTVVLASLLLITAAWRLSHGPVESAWLTSQVRSALAGNTGPVRISFTTVALAWEGFRQGTAHPLDLRIGGVDVTDANGHRLMTADDARLRFAFSDLLLGRVLPRWADIDRAQFTINRETTRLVERPDKPDPAAAQEARPDFDGFGIPVHLQQVHFHDSGIVFHDAASGLDVRSGSLDLDLTRDRAGHIHGSVRAPVTISYGTGSQEAADLTGTMLLAPSADSTITAHLTPLRPSVLGATAELAFLKAVDVPVSLNTTLTLDRDLLVRRFQLQGQFGAGQIRLGKGTAPLLAGSVALSGTPDRVVVQHLRLDLARAADGLPETLRASGTIDRTSDRIGGQLSAELEHVDAADLPRLWPEGIGGGARSWVTEHILGGLATHGSLAATIEADKDLHDVALTKAVADLDVAGASFTWLNDMPPIEQAEAHLHLADPDTLDITVATGVQRIAGRNADLLVKDGRMRISGLLNRHQTGDIQLGVEGPVVSVLALLSEPRLHLLSEHPMGIKPAGGDASAQLGFRFPLEDNLQIDDVDIHAEGRLTQVRIPEVVGRNALDDGTFDLTVDKDGLTLKGRGTLAGIPASLSGAMDFRNGPPDQVIERINVAGRADAAQLTAAGLPVTGVLAGPVPITAALTQKRGGDTQIAVNGDLTGCIVSFAPLAWRKPVGTTASLSALVKISHDRLVGIDRIAATGEGLSVLGSSLFTDNRLRSMTLDSVQLGRTQARGLVQVAPNGSVSVALQGPVIDLSDKLTETGPADGSEPSLTPPWSLDGHFDNAILANGEAARDLLVKAAGAGEKIRTIDAVGTVGESGRFSIAVAPAGAKRRLIVQAADAGRFLRGLDAIGTLQSGRLTIEGTLDSALGFSPLTGSAQMEQVVVRNSPVLGKLLQAITLYGLVDALRGPGMAFTRIAVPFRYDGHDLYLDNAVAENSSLGLTAQGRIGMGSAPSNLKGTIVPAYFFNALPGHLPVIGKLFSPEKGGGVFAARFGLEGPISDPTITINAASALTPGFLRNLFGMFDESPQVGQR